MTGAVPQPQRAAGTARVPSMSRVAVRPSTAAPWGAFAVVVQIAIDAATIATTNALVYVLYLASGAGHRHFDVAWYIQLDLVATVVLTAMLAAHGTYEVEEEVLRIQTTQRLLRAVLSTFLLFLALGALSGHVAFSRLVWAGALGATVVVLPLERELASGLRSRLLERAVGARPALIYGTGPLGRTLARRLLEDRVHGFRPVGFVDDDVRQRGELLSVGGGPDGARLPVVGGIDAVGAWAARHGVRDVFIAPHATGMEAVRRAAKRCEAHGLTCHVVLAGVGEPEERRLRDVGGIPVLTPRHLGARPVYEATKRVIDVAGAAVLLGVTAPLLALVAVLVRLDSPGPILFSHWRAGHGGKPFVLWKFRTMIGGADPDAPHPDGPGEARVTRIGRWLRRVSLDELPQLWNVLRGDMSLVGPRPEMLGIVARYRPGARQRLAVKPGLTGLWQISADRAFHIHENIAFDLYYIDRRSLLLDAAILLETPLAILRGVGAW